MAKPEKPVSQTIGRYLVAGFVAVALLAGGIGGWAAFAHISSAVVASGMVVVEGSAKEVQHREGGIVGEIRVKNGDRVKAGDLLVRLDETLLRANLEIIAAQLVDYEARMARLEAERDQRDSIDFPDHLLGAGVKPDAVKAVEGETTFFIARKSAVEGQLAQNREKIVQLNDQIVGLEAQRRSKREEIELIEKELEGLEELHKKGHVPVTRINALKRDAARLVGEERAFGSQIAVTKGQISETQLKLLQVERDFRESVLKELQDVQAKVAELRERRVAAQDQLNRSDIRAPVSGIVHELKVHTVGGVIQPGETFVKIIPIADSLVVDARISPVDIDQLQAGQPARVTFSAFNQRTTPQLSGKVKTISPDLSFDQATNTSYYTVRLDIADDELARLGELVLVPGMPAEVFITTGDRRVISYLVKPLADQFRRTFREQ
ncbi:HlyD family type I secretion periplasmic adaptor subunit [Rhodobium gokarnense]|uniref:Membrane fusion protein (MFP) family protein n=1 Tax=Rhodobium gokarnense TaxID=364296 RepID=A0ABT3HCS5_9HYPH|nr:HlyD family type I secretion periplasmic adaptor subunit [Rhodobium gokarnense]MCW2308216.1 HlyD family secretion protein [Rhodobium gokarnense]